MLPKTVIQKLLGRKIPFWAPLICDIVILMYPVGNSGRKGGEEQVPENESESGKRQREALTDTTAGTAGREKPGSGCTGQACREEPEAGCAGPASGPTAMLIRIFGTKDHEPYGDIVHYHLKKPVPYQGAAELVLRIDAISRSLNLPLSGTTFRSVRKPRDETGNVLPEEYWRDGTAGAAGMGARRKTPDRSPDPAAHSAADFDTDASPPPRVRDTIYLQLIGRQHTSIQGRIWGKATRKKYITFRSALELIYLLSEAV